MDPQSPKKRQARTINNAEELAPSEQVGPEQHRHSRDSAMKTWAKKLRATNCPWVATYKQASQGVPE